VSDLISSINLVSVLGGILGGLIGTLVFLTPGWILSTVYSRGLQGPSLSDRAFVAVTTFGGLIVHMLALPFTIWLGARIVTGGVAGQLGWLWLWSLGVLIIIPALLGAGFSFLSDVADKARPEWLRSFLRRLGISSSVRTADAWTWLFRGLREGAFFRLKLKDGSWRLGKFGDRSLASSDPSLRDIYLEEQWHADADGWFVARYPTSEGVWVSGDQIVDIAIFAGSPQDAKGEENADHRPA
jgi:hypothetical protein